MEKLTKEQLERTLKTIRDFKQLIADKNSKSEVVSYLMKETGLSKSECEQAFDIYNNIELPIDINNF
ncbi:MAG: hypothetical protein ACRC3H_00710 [Lachnospiraceae bacterium]